MSETPEQLVAELKHQVNTLLRDTDAIWATIERMEARLDHLDEWASAQETLSAPVKVHYHSPQCRCDND